ncbi:MAG: ring-hydroxylating oxygenase subunit alpha [Bradyrhizobium sp.]|nr:ring-hydroxylating oxygenase subunit alpha [Bradyrhizobium sp.]
MNEVTKLRRSSYTEALGLDTGPVSTLPYSSPEYFELERENIFKRAWLCLGRVEQLPQPNSYFVEELEFASVSVLVTRLKSGAVRAFHNVCSHRSNKIVQDSCGTASKLICRYHNWTFRNDGTLIGVPDEANFFGLDKARCGLAPIACDVWDGWIFVNLQPEPEVSLEEFLGAFGEEHRGLPYPNAATPIRFTARLRTNWKVIADAFAEAYHIPAIHPKTIGPMMKNPANPTQRPSGAWAWGPHHAYSTIGNPSYAPDARSNVERLASAGGAAFFVDDSAAAGAAHPAMNLARSAEWASDNTVIFPNFQVTRMSFQFVTFRFMPISHNETRWVSSFYLPEATDVQSRLQQEYYIARNCDILLEDVGNAESAQMGLETGAMKTMQLQDGEVMIRHALHHIQKWIDAPSVRDALL